MDRATLLREEGENLKNEFSSVKSALLAFDESILICKTIIGASPITNQKEAAILLTRNLIDKGELLTQAGDLERAIRLYEEVLQLNSTHNVVLTTPGVHINLCITYRTLGDNAKALKHASLAEESPGIDLKSLGILFENMADTYNEMGEHALAREIGWKAIRIFRKIDIPLYETITFSDIGDAWFKEGQYSKALEIYRDLPERYLKQSGNEIDRFYGRLLLSLGKIYMHIGEWNKALKTLHESQKVFLQDTTDSSPEYMPVHADLFIDNTLQDAFTFKGKTWQKRYAFSKNQSDLNLALLAFMAAQQLDDSLRSLHLFDQSKLRITQESHQRASWAFDVIRAFDNKRLGILDTAYLFMEQARARVLLDARHEALAQSTLSIADSFQQIKGELEFQEVELRTLRETGAPVDSIQKMTIALSHKREELEALKRQEMDGERVREFQSQNRPVSYQAFAAWLPDSTTFLWYHWGEDQVTLLTHNSKGLALHSLGSPDNLRARIEALQIMLGNPNSPISKTHEQGELLLTMLIPSSTILNNKLIISPDGPITRLPFEVLKQSNGAYLIENHQISYALSATTLIQAPEQQAVSSVLAVAPSRWKELSLLPLQQSNNELKAITAHWENTEQLVAEAATKSNLRERLSTKSYDIIHLCTHAQAGNSLGKENWIALNDSEENYLLYLDELYGLNLNTELAVLSACQTGIGELAKGEGSMSLARGFTYAGCRSVIASMWKVEHEPNAWIIGRFYDYLAQGVPKDQALRLAKLDFMNPSEQDQWEIHPHHWAAMTAIGDMGAIQIQKSSGFQSYYALAILMILIILILVWRAKS